MSFYIGGNNPFRSLGGEWIDTKSRLERVRQMSPADLLAVLALPSHQLQKTVREAAERRLRKLSKILA